MPQPLALIFSCLLYLSATSSAERYNVTNTWNMPVSLEGYVSHNPKKRHEGRGIYPEETPLTTKERQSPIDIEEYKAVQSNLPELHFGNTKPCKTIVPVTNEKGRVSLDMRELSPRPSVTGGPTTLKYKMKTVQFRWGAEDEGSEHLLSGKSFDAEIQVTYEIPETQVTQKNPKHLIIAYFIESRHNDNEHFEALCRALAKVRRHGSHVKLNAASFLQLLEELSKQDSYFTYAGSLTEPPYTEATWMIFPNPTKISCEQLNLMKKVKDEKGHVIHHNIRRRFKLGRRSLLIVRTGFADEKRNKLNS